MANQYALESFRECLEKHYNCSVDEALEVLMTQKLSYKDVADQLNYQESTVRKWCRRFNIVLNPHRNTSINDCSSSINLTQFDLGCAKISSKNFLYKSWTAHV